MGLFNSASSHQSVHDYIDAKRAGDEETTARIIREVAGRFDTRTTDGSEAADLMEATMRVRLGEGRD